jgi:hypothetical protein
LVSYTGNPAGLVTLRCIAARHEDKAYRLSWAPFGSGPHKCIGMHFGGMEVKAVMHQMIRRYTWHVPAGYSPPIGYGTGPVPIGGLPIDLSEPGGARTGFRHGSAQLAPALEAYASTPAAFLRGMLADQTHPSPGDPAKMAAIIIGSVDTTPPPKRIVLGSDSYAIILNAPTQRLADIEPQKDLAASSDFATTPDGPR